MYDLVVTLGYQVSFQSQIDDSASVLTSEECPDASVPCFAALLTISQAPVSSRPGDTDKLFTCTHPWLCLPFPFLESICPSALFSLFYLQIKSFLKGFSWSLTLLPIDH